MTCFEIGDRVRYRKKDWVVVHHDILNGGNTREVCLVREGFWPIKLIRSVYDDDIEQIVPRKQDIYGKDNVNGNQS